MVELNTLSESDKKIICEALDLTFRGQSITKEMAENLSNDGKEFLAESLINSLPADLQKSVRSVTE